MDNQTNRIKIEICIPITETSSLLEALNKINGIKAEIPSPTMAFDSSFDIPRWFDVIINITSDSVSDVILGLITSAIYDKIKKSSKNKAMINGSDLLQNAFELPPCERVELIERLFHSLNTSNKTQADSAWADEFESRLDAYKEGKIDASPVEEVMVKINKR